MEEIEPVFLDTLIYGVNNLNDESGVKNKEEQKISDQCEGNEQPMNKNQK